MADEPQDSMAREIEEELRRERLLRLWDTYGTYILAVAVLLVVGVGGWKYYENRRVQANEAASTQYLVALRDFAVKKPYAAQKALEDLAAKAPDGYAAMARLRLAAYDRTEGDKAYALAAYDKIAKDGSVDPIFQDFARLQSAMSKFDSASFTELKNQLSPLATDRNPWRHSARELLGLGAAKAGRPGEARNHFQRLLADPVTPQGISSRAKVMMALLTEVERGNAPLIATEKSETPPKLLPSLEGTGKAAPDGNTSK